MKTLPIPNEDLEGRTNMTECVSRGKHFSTICSPNPVLSDNHVASKKVALSALGKRRMKNVDKDIDKNNKQ